MKREKNNTKRTRIKEIDREINKLMTERAGLSGEARIPNTLYQDLLAFAENDSEQIEYNACNIKSLKQGLSVMKNAINKIEELLKDAKKVYWYGDYTK